MDENLPVPERAPRDRRATVAVLGAPQFQIEAPEIERLVRVRRDLDVLLESVILVGLDYDDPRVVLQQEFRHLPVRLAAELFVEREAGGAAQLVELWVPPVVLDAARGEKPPHHAVGVTEGRCGVRPPQTLE